MSSEIEIIGSIQEEISAAAEETMKPSTPQEKTPESVKDKSPDALEKDDKSIENGFKDDSDVEIIGSVEEVKEDVLEGLS